MEVLPPRRDAYGRWLRGTPSPNPSGCIPKAGREVLELAREGSLAAMRRLIAIVNEEGAPYGAQIAAAMAVLDRAWGKSRVSLEVEDKGQTLEQMLTAIWAAREAEEALERAGGEPPAPKMLSSP